MTYILGVNAYHGDASACLVRDGDLIAAAEEERFRRIKHWAGFPSEAVRYCLAEAGIKIGDVNVVAINQDAKANVWKKVTYTLMRRPDMALVLDRIRNKQERLGVATELSRAFPNETVSAEIQEIEHHLADPEGELEELAEIYEERGLNKDLAKQVAIALTEHDALGAHLREELGHHEASKARPLQAALTSAAAITAGGVIPFFGLFFTGAMRGPAITAISVLGLFIAGYLSARAAGCGILRPTMRVVIGGSLAMAVTFVVGTLFGGVA